MSKKSKKRKHRRLSSSSSDEDKKASKAKYHANTSKSASKPEVKQQESSAKQGKSVSSAIKDDSKTTRKIKKPVYKLAKAKGADQKPVDAEVYCTKTKSDRAQPPKGDFPSTTKHISGKNDTVSCSTTAEKNPSNPGSITSKIPHRTERTSKVNVNKASSLRNPSKSKKELIGPCLASAKQNDMRHTLLKKEHRAEKSTRTEDDRSSVKTKEQGYTSSMSDSSAQQKQDSAKQMYLERECKPKKSLWVPIPSASATRNSSILTIHPTSESSPKVLKNVTSVVGRVTSMSSKTTQSSPKQKILFSKPPLCQSFKIPKKVMPRPVDITDGKKNVPSKCTNLSNETKLSDSKVSVRTSTQERVQQPHSYLNAAPGIPLEGHDTRSSLPGQLPTVSDTDTEPRDDQMQVVEELHFARSQKILEVDVSQIYGELTCMDIDPPDESSTDLHYKQASQQDLILVLDTNILLSHLKYIKNIRSHGLGALGFPVVLIPWVVLQELDSLKKGRGLSDSVSHLATPAISYIYTCLKSREPNLWGQSMQQATDSSCGLNAENNDDRVLQCCLQYQGLYPGCALILCTNDKNLCSKAFFSGVKAVSQSDLEAEVGTSKGGRQLLQKPQNTTLPQANYQVPSKVSGCKPVQQHSQCSTNLSLGCTEKVTDGLQLSGDKWDLSRCVSELKECLQQVLSDVLEVEMKAVYEDLWLEIVYLKPPWTLLDVLQCFKKHWIAVFGHVVPRTKHQNVLHLIDFFNSGKTMDCSSTLEALQEAADLVKAFRKRSSRVPRAISVMDNISIKLRPQGDSPAGDVIMVDDDEDKPPSPAQISHQEVWALFENIWSNVVQVSLEVFKALGFDPLTMQTAHPARAPPPLPQEALACLHKLSSMVSQLLQAFSSVLCSAPGLEDVQTLLNIIHANEIVSVDSRLSARDLLDCFSQQEYREKLRVGGNQLMEVKQTLDRCVEATGTFTT